MYFQAIVMLSSLFLSHIVTASDFFQTILTFIDSHLYQLLALLLSISGITILFFWQYNGKKISNILPDLQKKARDIGKNKRALSDMSVTLSSITSQNNVAIGEVREAANDIEEVLEESTQKFQEIKQISQQNITSSRKRELEIQDFMQSLDDLISHTEEISDITDILNDISTQTNILSFNASIEAARAGEAGSGFAVVADSVRNLAQRSMKATSQITETIEQTLDEINKISDQADDTVEAVNEIVENTQKTDSLLSDAINVMMKQNEGAQQIIEAANVLENNISQNLEAAQISSESSIRMAVDLYEFQIRAQKLQRDGSAQYLESDHDIQPLHVFHFNLTNTLPTLNSLAGTSFSHSHYDKIFPNRQNENVDPAQVFRKMYTLTSEFSEEFDLEFDFQMIKNRKIKPIDVLCISVMFLDLVRTVQERLVPEKELLIEYEKWRSRKQEITPGDVYNLIVYFENSVANIRI